MRTPRLRSTVATAALAIIAATGLAACGSDDGGGDPNNITVWSLDNQTDRVQAAQKAADAFTAKTGIKVKIVGTDENQYASLITSAAAAGKLPDVVGALPLTAVWQMHTQGLLDTDSAKAVVDGLGASTFSARSLELTRSQGKQLAVPSDAWAQMLVYRKDLFDRAGLGVPDTFDKIREAAQKLNTGGVAGITMATVPDDAFTAQTFEMFALANGCEMVDNAGAVKLDSRNCVNAFNLYGDLVRRYSVPGAQDVDSTRATYFAGKAAMVVWSSFLLDEMAGLRKDAAPSCGPCAADPTFLAKNSGIVTAIKGPDGSEPAGFGELTSWTITSGASKESARKFVSYMMDEGYLDWIGMAPEGKFPVRKGTAAEATKFTEGWNKLPAGVDTKRPLGELYPPEVLTAMRNGPDNMRRWAITQGHGPLLGATLGELPVAKAVNALTSGSGDGAAAAKQANDAVKAIQSGLK